MEPPSLRPLPAALDELRQLGEHRWRVALGGRRLAHGQGDFPLGLGEAREGVHDQQHMQALVAEMLGDGGGIGGAVQTQQGRRVGRGGDHGGAFQPFLAEDVLDEILDLAAAFADQADHHDIGRGIARHHAQQHGFAHAAAGEQAHALATPHGEQGIDGADAHVKHVLDRFPFHGIDGREWSGARREASSAPKRSSGRPAPSITRPSNSGPTATCRMRSSIRRRR
jgi:hypothetical protein